MGNKFLLYVSRIFNSFEFLTISASEKLFLSELLNRELKTVHRKIYHS